MKPEELTTDELRDKLNACACQFEADACETCAALLDELFIRPDRAITTLIS